MVMNLNSINSIKRPIVEDICNIVKESGIVKRLFVFGSSVTNECSEDSDIDLCLDTDYADANVNLIRLYQKIGKACDFDCDILKYNKLGAGLKSEVDRKGVVVYDIEQS